MISVRSQWGRYNLPRNHSNSHEKLPVPVPAVFLTSSRGEPMGNQWLFHGELPPAMDLPTHVVDNFGIPQLITEEWRLQCILTYTYSICAKEWGLEKGTLHPLKRSGIIYFKEMFHLSSRILWILAASSRENCTCWKMLFQFLSEVLLHLGMLPTLYRNLPLSERKAGNTAS